MRLSMQIKTVYVIGKMCVLAVIKLSYLETKLRIIFKYFYIKL